ncbi:guanylate kinase [Claveliimonas bilis]|uniref:Guanylate kinase n=1 Tax=Claveliimonas bilis TaxID=3028070 RepID=A0ABM8I724_9FIRM|nr:guanylate kinase [Claveliimonas bilis]BDZ76012.1 guanylate kinase [Claveliimonas bilis]
MGKIFYIMGKSASGKDTIFRELKERCPQLGMVVPYTTRPIRAGEKNGVEYFFTDEAALAKMEAEHKIIEIRSYDTVHGIWKYFTAADGQIDLESSDYLMIGTLESYGKMREYYGEEHLIPLYIEVEDGERLTRALLRERQQAQPKYKEMCRRFLADEEDFSEENLKKLGIRRRFDNSSKEQCLEEITEVIYNGKL